MSVPIKEQETIISFSRDDERANIYTSDSTMITKLEKRVNADGSEWILEKIIKDKNGKEVARNYSCPKKCVGYRTKRIRRVLTDEEKQILSDRMKRIWKMNKERVKANE